MKRERGEGSEKSDEPEEREKGKKGERSGVRIPKAVPALQAVVVLKAVLVDGLADLTADLAADGAAAEASHGGACGATAVEGFDAGGLALGATGHGGSPWVCDVKERRATERTDKEKAPGAGHAGLEGGGERWDGYQDGIAPGSAGSCRAGRLSLGLILKLGFHSRWCYVTEKKTDRLARASSHQIGR